MSRKKKSRYESFSFGGQTYAPESVWFKLNDKPIKITDRNKERDLQYKAICGKYKEVVAELKRMERKEAREKKVKQDRKSTRLNSSHDQRSRMPSSA